MKRLLQWLRTQAKSQSVEKQTLDQKIKGRYEKLVQIQQQQQQQRAKADTAAAMSSQEQREQRETNDDQATSRQKKGLTSWDAMRWLSRQPRPESPTAQKGKHSDAAFPASAAGPVDGQASAANNSSSLLLAGAAAAFAATNATSGFGNLLTAFLKPHSLTSTTAATPPQEAGTAAMLSTFSHLVFLRAILRIVFRVMVLVRLARFRNSATPISALVLNELLG